MEGSRAISQIAQASPDRISELLYCEDMEKIPGLTYPCRQFTTKQFLSICVSKHPSGPLAVVTIPSDYTSQNVSVYARNKVLCLEDVQDPGNVGTLIRSAAAFDYSGIICSDKCADIFSPKVVQSTCGALVSLWFRRTPDFQGALKMLKDKGLNIVAADVHGKNLGEDEGAGKKDEGGRMKDEGIALVLGNEGVGISSATLAMADQRLKIPFNDKKVESLNVAASGAILMHYFSTKT